jgi:hypothetical protein
MVNTESQFLSSGEFLEAVGRELDKVKRILEIASSLRVGCVYEVAYSNYRRTGSGVLVGSIVGFDREHISSSVGVSSVYRVCLDVVAVSGRDPMMMGDSVQVPLPWATFRPLVKADLPRYVSWVLRPLYEEILKGRGFDSGGLLHV